MTGYVHVRIQPLDYPSNLDVDAAISLEEWIVRETYESLDHPSVDADPITRGLICTDAVTIRKVRKRREYVADMVVKVLKDKIIKSMGSNDTLMGYPAEDL